MNIFSRSCYKCIIFIILILKRVINLVTEITKILPLAFVHDILISNFQYLIKLINFIITFALKFGTSFD